MTSLASLAHRAQRVVRVYGLRAAAAHVLRRLDTRPVAGFAAVAPRVAGRTGLEIGGPSVVFGARGLLPVYPIAGRVDNTNFAAETVWEGSIEAGRTFRFDDAREPGTQYLLEAVDLRGIADGAYDFVLSSHSLEHVANPLAALAEWRRVVAPGGTLVVVLPHRDATFDRRRPVTPLQHLRDDFARATREDDLSHVPEVLALHDTAWDDGVRDPEEFRAHCNANHAHRCLHHHTFVTESAAAMLDAAGLRLLAVDTARPHHIVLVAERPGDGRPVANGAYLGRDAAWRRRSPFPSDRRPLADACA